MEQSTKQPFMKISLLFVILFACQFAKGLEHYKQINFAHKSTELTDGTKEYIKKLCVEQSVNELYILKFLTDEETVLTIAVQDSISYIRASKTAEFIRENGLIHGKVLIQHQNYIVMPDRHVLSKEVRDGKGTKHGVYRLSVFKKPQFNHPTHLSADPRAKSDCQSSYIYITEKNLVAFRQGTVIEIPANALVLHNGKAPRGNNAEICVSEYYDKDDIIAADLCTISGDKMLVSGGMVHVKIFCDEGELVLASGEQIRVYMPSMSTSADMQTFHGNEKEGLLDWKLSDRDGVEATSLSAQDYFDQDIADAGSTPEGVNEYGETEWADFNPEMERMAGVIDGVVMGGSEGGHVLKSSKLDWINCDRFYEVENKTNMLVMVDTTTSTAIRMIFHDIKSVMPGYVYNKEKSASFENIPVGERVTVIVYALSKDETKVKFGMKDLLVGDKPVIDLSVLEEMTIDQMTQKIAGKF
jgi:hypothetical protein